GHAVVLASGELDHAATRGNADHVAGRDAELCDRGTRHVGDGARLERVERRRAPRHGASVPMLELAAGGEYERILGVRLLVRWLQFCGHQLAKTARARKTLVEHHIAAGLVGRIGW